jgi:hypothetical protein
MTKGPDEDAITSTINHLRYFASDCNAWLS